MSERILPGVTVNEVTEGIIGVPTPGSIAAKLVGTACKGSYEPQWFDNFSDIKREYGPVDPYQYSTSTGTNPPQELTLTRAADLLYKHPPPGGVWIRRVGVGGAAVGTGVALSTGDITFTAQEEGSWYNNFQYRHEVDKNSIGQTEVGVSTIYLRIPSRDLIDTNKVTDGNIVESKNPLFGGDEIVFEYVSVAGGTSPLASDFVTQWNTSVWTSHFLVASTSTGTVSQQTAYTSIYTSGNTSGFNWSTNDNGIAATGDYLTALEDLRTKADCYITIIAGCDGDTSGRFAGVGSIGAAHALECSLEKNEQSYIFGSEIEANASTFLADMTGSGYAFADPRVIKVAPGMKAPNAFKDKSGTWLMSTVTTDNYIVMSGGYAAAMVAGVICQQIPDQSPMNKPIITYNLGLEHEFGAGKLKTLVRENFFLLVNDSGYRTLRDITCGGPSDPFYHISLRMAVDETRRALRLAGKGWIGKKNNFRNRQGLRSSLAFVMKQREGREIISPGWELSVTSDRQEQIIGVVTVVLKVQYVYYMEFIEISLVLE